MSLTKSHDRRLAGVCGGIAEKLAAGRPASTPNRRVEFEVSYPSQPAVPVFNDLNSFWSADTSAAGVIVPRTGTSIRVVSTSAQDSFMHVHVGPVQ